MNFSELKSANSCLMYLGTLPIACIRNTKFSRKSSLSYRFKYIVTWLYYKINSKHILKYTGGVCTVKLCAAETLLQNCKLRYLQFCNVQRANKWNYSLEIRINQEKFSGFYRQIIKTFNYVSDPGMKSLSMLWWFLAVEIAPGPLEMLLHEKNIKRPSTCFEAIHIAPFTRLIDFTRGRTWSQALYIQTLQFFKSVFKSTCFGLKFCYHVGSLFNYIGTARKNLNLGNVRPVLGKGLNSLNFPTSWENII